MPPWRPAACRALLGKAPKRYRPGHTESNGMCCVQPSGTPSTSLAGHSVTGTGQPDEPQVLVRPAMRSEMSDPRLDHRRRHQRVVGIDLDAIGAAGAGHGYRTERHRHGSHGRCPLSATTVRRDTASEDSRGQRGAPGPANSSAKRTPVYAHDVMARQVFVVTMAYPTT